MQKCFKFFSNKILSLGKYGLCVLSFLFFKFVVIAIVVFRARCAILRHRRQVHAVVACPGSVYHGARGHWLIGGCRSGAAVNSNELVRGQIILSPWSLTSDTESPRKPPSDSRNSNPPK